MAKKPNPTTIQVIHDQRGKSVLIVSHPYLEAPLYINPKDPGFLSTIDRDSYNFAFSHIEHKIWHDLNTALMEQLDLTEDQAEDITDAWDTWATGYEPHHSVEPITFA